MCDYIEIISRLELEPFLQISCKIFNKNIFIVYKYIGFLLFTLVMIFLENTPFISRQLNPFNDDAVLRDRRPSFFPPS